MRASPEVTTVTFERGRDFGDGLGYRILTTGNTYQNYIRSYSGTRTPGFRNLKGRMLPVNPYSMTVTRVSDSQAMQDVKEKSAFNDSLVVYNLNIDSTRFLYPIVNSPIPSTGHDQVASDNAVSKLAERAEADLNANVAQDIAQMNQTVSLITGTVGRITSAISAVKRGKIASAVAALGTPPPRSSSRIRVSKGRQSAAQVVANNWLELQYGWKPLLSDIDGAMRNLANSIHKSGGVRTVSASSSKSNGDSGSFTCPYVGGGPPQGSWNFSTTTTSRYGLSFQIDNSLIAFLGQTGFTNPLNLAWEVLPYSFVVDWFVPIGPYLESMSAFAGCTFLRGYWSRRTVTEYSAAIAFSGRGTGESPNVNRIDRGALNIQTVQYDRTPLSGFPRRTIPALKNPISTLHATNAIALMVQAFRL
jgi:hypothetical protein